MAEITQRNLDDMIARHELWLKNGAIGKTSSFTGLDLSGLELKKSNLFHSDFSGCNLKGCNFHYSDLGYSDLRNADLTGANLKAVNLFRANLQQAVLDHVVVNEHTMFYFPLCPEEGGFTGYKKAETDRAEYAIIKLWIPEEAKRNSATTYRCKASKAKVLEIVDETGNVLDKAWSNRDSGFVYETGKWLEEPEFDENRWNEKSKGIHFYLSKELAKCY